MTRTRPLLGRTGMIQVALLLGFVAVAAAVVAVAAPLYRLAQDGGYVEVHRGDVQAGVAEHLSDGVLFVAVLLLAGAEAFRRGQELADDVAGLV